LPSRVGSSYFLPVISTDSFPASMNHEAGLTAGFLFLYNHFRFELLRLVPYNRMPRPRIFRVVDDYYTATVLPRRPRSPVRLVIILVSLHLLLLDPKCSPEIIHLSLILIVLIIVLCDQCANVFLNHCARMPDFLTLHITLCKVQ